MIAELSRRAGFNPAQTFTPIEATLIPTGEFPAADRQTSRRP